MTQTMWQTAAQAADDKLADNVVVRDVAAILGIADAFVIASANNVRQVRTIADEVEARMKAEWGISARSVEGLEDATWILIDFGDVVVHVFLETTREYYGLDRLWKDAPRLEWRTHAAASA